MDKTKRRRERLARQTGSPGDRAAHLLAMLRAGDLVPDELMLAAHLRSKAAMILLERNEREPIEIQNWGAKLATFGSLVMVRAGHAMATKCLAVGREYSFGRWRAELHDIVDAGERWLSDPDGRDEAALTMAHTAQQVMDEAEGTRLGFSARSSLGFNGVITYGQMMGGAGVSMPHDIGLESLWHSEGDGADWVCFARLVATTAWLADGSGRIADWVYRQPCRAAILHTIGFLRSRLLTDEKWRAA